VDLIPFSEIKKALQQSTSIHEVKNIRDKAESLRTYLKQANEGLEMQNRCAEIKVRAERRAGEILNSSVKNPGTRLGGNIVLPPHPDIPTLDELGISKIQSSRYQLIASIPQDLFELHISEIMSLADKELTSAEFLRIAKQLKNDTKFEYLKSQIGPKTEDSGIFCGDCVKFMQNMTENTVDITVTSPPYDDLREKQGEFDYKNVVEGLFRVTKPGGVVVWVVGDATVDGSETGSSFRQALYFKEIGFNLHDTMIYQKSGVSYPSEGRYTQVFEYMFVFSKGRPKTFHPIVDEVKYWNGSWGELSTRNKDGSLRKRNLSNEGKGNSGRSDDGRYGYKQRTNIWKINNGKSFGHSDEFAVLHPSTFPEQIAQDHIITWSNQGDLVFDPMCGSGTTLKIAKMLKRRYLGVDINEEYCEIAKRRLSLIQDF